MTTFIKNDKNRRRFNILGHLWQSKLCNYTIQCPVLMTPFVHLVFCRHYHDLSSIICPWDILSFFFFLAETHLRGWEAARLTPYTRILLAKRVRTIFEWPRKMVSVSVRYSFMSQWMKRSKHGLFNLPPKKTLIWRRHCLIGQSPCSMTSKRSIELFLESSWAWSFFTRASA